MKRHFLLCTVLAAGSFVVAQADDDLTVWEETFDDGLSQVSPYHADEPSELFEIVEESAPEENFFLRATLPGSRSLEGIQFVVPSIPGNRLATISAKLRGTGTIGMMFRSGNGWLYPPSPITLNHEWQEVEFKKTLQGKETDGMVIYLLTQPTSTVLTGVEIEVDDLKIVLDPPMELSDAEVPSKFLAATDFAAKTGTVNQDGDQKFLQDEKRIEMAGVPFPQTSQLVAVYACVRGTFLDEAHLQVATDRGGMDQTIRDVVVSPSEDWQWVPMGDISAEEVGETMQIRFFTGEESVALRGVVVSTKSNLDEASLEAVLKEQKL